MSVFKIQDREIGVGHPCYIIAEELFWEDRNAEASCESLLATREHNFTKTNI